MRSHSARPLSAALSLLVAAGLLPRAASAQEPVLVLDGTLHHLGDSRVPSWTDVPADPEGTRLELAFTAERNAVEHVLSLRYRDVDERWSIRLNGVEIGALARGKAFATFHHIVPAGTLVTGENELVVATAKTADDIVIGDVRLHLQPLRDVLRLQPVEVRVRDREGRPLPAKITVTDPQDAPVDVWYAARLHTAVRRGICYTGDGAARLELPPGDFVLFAGRGMEWGVARAAIRVDTAAPGAAPVGPIELVIGREVETAGFIAADTHVHTLTFSGHGDASVEERLVTLAGEGVELAVATDHNHHTDYRPAQAELDLHEHFTPVTGNEVTTKVGHINAFPFDPGGSRPDHRLNDWITLVSDIRAKGAKVVVLNHPRWPQIPTGPFGVFHLDRMTGELSGQRGVPFDAMELVNSTALQNDPCYLLVDWFALLNHGERVTAVGTSDSHTVGDPVGQGRTYVRSATDDPAAIDVDAACRAFVEGRTTVSLGIFCDVAVEERHGTGDLVAVADRRVELSLRVAAPSWVRPRLARVYVNGVPAAEQAVPVVEGRPTDARLAFSVALPPHDGYLVCVVTGDGVGRAHWRTEKPYTFAATNPVYFDVDGDGRYASPRATASALVGEHGVEARLVAALAEVDDAVAVEALSFARAEYEAGAGDLAGLQRARARLAELAAAAPGREVFARYLRSLPPPEKVVEDAAGAGKSPGAGR